MKEALVTSHGIIKIQETFKTDRQARQAGYEYWFTHEKQDIYSKDDMQFAVVVKE